MPKNPVLHDAVWRNPVLKSCGCTEEREDFFDRVVARPTLDALDCMQCEGQSAPWAVPNYAVQSDRLSTTSVSNDILRYPPDITLVAYVPDSVQWHLSAADPGVNAAVRMQWAPSENRMDFFSELLVRCKARLTDQDTAGFLRDLHVLSKNTEELSERNSRVVSALVSTYRSQPAKDKTIHKGIPEDRLLDIRTDAITCDDMVRPATLWCGHSFDRSTVLALDKKECPHCRRSLLGWWFDNASLSEALSSAVTSDSDPFIGVDGPFPVRAIRYSKYIRCAQVEIVKAQVEDVSSLSKVRLLGKALSHDPTSRLARLMRARLNAELRRVEAAYLDYRGVLLQNPSDGAILDEAVSYFIDRRHGLHVLDLCFIAASGDDALLQHIRKGLSIVLSEVGRVGGQRLTLAGRMTVLRALSRVGFDRTVLYVAAHLLIGPHAADETWDITTRSEYVGRLLLGGFLHEACGVVEADARPLDALSSALVSLAQTKRPAMQGLFLQMGRSFQSQNPSKPQPGSGVDAGGSAIEILSSAISVHRALSLISGKCWLDPRAFDCILGDIICESGMSCNDPKQAATLLHSWFIAQPSLFNSHASLVLAHCAFDAQHRGIKIEHQVEKYVHENWATWRMNMTCYSEEVELIDRIERKKNRLGAAGARLVSSDPAVHHGYLRSVAETFRPAAALAWPQKLAAAFGLFIAIPATIWLWFMRSARPGRLR
jgi:hypothetical protein